MKRFDFPLERVRRWRCEQATLEELKLQQFRAEMASLQAAQQQIVADRVESEQHVLTQAYVDPLQLESLDSYRQYTAGKVRHLESRKQQWEAKIADQLNKVIEARRKFELLERLRQAALDEWQAAVDKEQEDLAAELFLAKSSQRKR
jgi:hypothetical protein